MYVFWVEYKSNTKDNCLNYTRTERWTARGAAVHHVHRAVAAEHARHATPAGEEAHDARRYPRARADLPFLTIIRTFAL